MKIVIAGGTGFLGRPLAAALAADRHDVVILSRRSNTASRSAPQSRVVDWTPDGTLGAWASELDGAAAVINLAGESIAAKRWSASQKERIRSSRVNATRGLVAAIKSAASPPAAFVSGSAVGYYGSRGEEILTERSGAGADFLASVCVQWEAAAAEASSQRTRVVCIRTGLPLETDGGALAPMLPLFRLGVGGPIGSGRQYWPWIHRADWIGLVRWIVRTDSAAGAFNATTPEPVTNAAFVKALGRALHRPAILPAPGFALRLMLGEMADGLLLSGQRAVPERATAAGFTFQFPRLESAFNAIFVKKPKGV